MSRAVWQFNLSQKGCEACHMEGCNMSEVTILPRSTSACELLQQYLAVLRFVRIAQNEACKARPHGRDYQTIQAPNAYETAQAEYESQVMRKLDGVVKYLEELTDGVYEQM